MTDENTGRCLCDVEHVVETLPGGPLHMVADEPAAKHCIGCGSVLASATFDGRPLDRALCNTCELDRAVGLCGAFEKTATDPVLRAAWFEARIQLACALERWRFAAGKP